MQNKKRLLIIGASGFGRELESWLEMIPNEKRDWNIYGYLDRNKSALDCFQSDYEVFGDEDSFEFLENDLVVLAIADPEIKKKIYTKLKDKVQFLTFIAPNAVVGKNNKIGEGTVICPNTIISTNVDIGKCSTINCNSTVGHDVTIGAFSAIMPNVDLGGHVKLGEGVFLGTKTVVIPSKSVGEYAFVGAGSVVIKKIKPFKRVVGNPTREI